ncbi:hypothetical protein SALBM217S_08063 [Streptomyces griseoloalbus]
MYARFPLTLLGVREDCLLDEGDAAALDRLDAAPPGYRLLPAHPWQLDLAADDLAPAFADGRLVRLGETRGAVWPTAAVRTVYAPGDDLFLKFSLDVRITNDVRRLGGTTWPACAPPTRPYGTPSPTARRAGPG